MQVVERGNTGRAFRMDDRKQRLVVDRTLKEGERYFGWEVADAAALDALAARLERAGIQPSMSRAGCPWDNAMAESFMRTLKREEVNGQAYRNQIETETSIGVFIEEVYNRQRLHSALAYLAPADFEVARASPPCLAPPETRVDVSLAALSITLSL